MSQFNKKIEAARRRQKRLYLMVAGGTLVCLFAVIVAFMVSRGTRIEVLPVDAQEDAQLEVTRGIGFAVGDTVYSLTTTPEISVFSPGFKVNQQVISPQYLGHVFAVELFELPGRLVASTGESDPSLVQDTVWRINGRERKIGAELDLELEAGEYQLVIDNPYFQEEDVDVEIRREEETTLDLHLSRINGLLDIDSTPQGATVFAGDKQLGITPLSLNREGRSYQLRISKENYRDSFETVEITRASPDVVRNYQLKRAQAEVAFDLVPAGGRLLVDGVQIDQASSVQVDATVDHHISYGKSGYYSQKKSVNLQEDEQKQLTFTLKKELGRVTIVSTPAATVYIGKQKYGVTPITVNLVAVPQRILIKKEGYRTVTKTVLPKGSATQRVDIRLVPESQARLQESPAQYTNKAGIKLKLYKPNEQFFIGANRSEKGQRANESVRRVRLTKPFYASAYEVTNEQYGRFIKTTGQGNNPAVSVSWQEAAVYCNWLSRTEKLTPFYTVSAGAVVGFNSSANGYRLLTEAEWEWLARKEGKKKESIFTWGNESVVPARAANVADESAKGTVRFYVPQYTDGFSGSAPVGSFTQEPSGLYDQGGNVSEWTHDVYSIVPQVSGTVATNPLGKQSGSSHVVKGANYRSGTITTLRPAFREGLAAGRDDLGFRIGRFL